MDIPLLVFKVCIKKQLKLNYRKKIFYFALNFLPWEFLLIKKLDFKKTKATQYTTFKTDIIKVVLVFSISNFFTNKNSQGRKLSAIQLQQFSFNDRKNCCAIPQHHANNMDRILMFSVVESYLNHLVEFRQENFHCLMKMIKTVNG